MLWIVIGVFVLGVACGAALRLLFFAGVLLAAAMITVAATSTQGVGTALLDAVITIVTLQAGYAAGFVLRAAGVSFAARGPARGPEKQPIAAPFGEKRR